MERGWGFGDRFSYVCKNHTPSPEHPQHYRGRNEERDRDRYSRYRIYRDRLPAKLLQTYQEEMQSRRGRSRSILQSADQYHCSHGKAPWGSPRCKSALDELPMVDDRLHSSFSPQGSHHPLKKERLRSSCG